MKISVDADKLNQAFDIVAKVNNELVSCGATHAPKELQKVLEIIGPMYDGINEAQTPVTFSEWLNNTKSSNILKRIEKLEEFNARFPYIEPSTIADGLAQEYVNKKAIIDMLDAITGYLGNVGVVNIDNISEFNLLRSLSQTKSMLEGK